jgi:hypothetical protein
MVDDRSIVEHAHEIQLLAGELAHFNCALPDMFVVIGIIPNCLHLGGVLLRPLNTRGRS